MNHLANPKTILALSAIALVLTLAGCGKKEGEGAQDGNAKQETGTEQTQGTDKSSADLARLRELAEKEDAEREAAKRKSESFNKELSKGLKAPIKEYKY